MAEEKVEQVSVSKSELDELLGGNSQNVMVPEKTNTFFKNTEREAEKKASNILDEAIKTPPQPSLQKEVADILDGNPEAVDDKDEKSVGRKPYEKSLAVETIKDLISDGTFQPFEGDERPLEEYTKKDLIELIKVNIEEKQKEYEAKLPVDFFEALPVELQAAAKYVADGGTDLKAMLNVLLRTEESKSLNITDDTDQETIVRNWLVATNFGSPEEVEEEILDLKDRGSLQKKAEQFKPKLIAKQNEIVAFELEKTEKLKKQQEKVLLSYQESVVKVLDKDDLNGIPLDKKTQNMLYEGMLNPKYPSRSGRQTNLLGYLLEKNQFVEPNHGLVAEVLWLLSNPEDYKSKIREGVKKEAVAENVRKLKMAESDKKTATTFQESSESNRVKGIKKPTGLFKRN